MDGEKSKGTKGLSPLGTSLLKLITGAGGNSETLTTVGKTVCPGVLGPS
jgi:hypothetical protein